jgi:hypothetical protein
MALGTNGERPYFLGKVRPQKGERSANRKHTPGKVSEATGITFSASRDAFAAD